MRRRAVRHRRHPRRLHLPPRRRPGTGHSAASVTRRRCGASTAPSGWAATSWSRHVAGDEIEEQHGDDLRDFLAQGVPRDPHRGPPAAGCRRPGPQPARRRGYRSPSRRPATLSSRGRPSTCSASAIRIEALTTSEDVDGSKPDPDLIQATLDRLGEVDAAVFVGDTPYDVEAAGRAGMGCIAVLTGGFSRAELTDAGASLVVESLAELVDADWAPYLS